MKGPFQSTVSVADLRLMWKVIWFLLAFHVEGADFFCPDTPQTGAAGPLSGNIHKGFGITD